jgi:hypothetical protein
VIASKGALNAGDPDMARRLLLVLAIVTLAGGAAPSPTSAASPSLPAVHPADFVTAVTNPWLPFRPGTTTTFKGVREGKPTVVVVTVTNKTKLILGVRTTVVSDRVYTAGKLSERTTDWYAQDKSGNVWYFGEATAELDATGHVTSTEGSWQAGVGGARAGIVMPGTPGVGQSFRQEYLRGHAEDQSAILSLHATVHTPLVTVTGKAILTKEWTRLEPSVLENKYYIRGVGEVKSTTVKGPPEVMSLVSVIHH